MSDIDAVRRRPGMYVGAIDDGTGLHRVLFEVVDNAINEGLAGYCSRIEVTLAPNGSVTVLDDGRGMPVDVDGKTGTSKAEIILSRMLPYYSGEEAPGALQGGGVFIVNALSAWLNLRVWRDGREHVMRFEEGRLVAPLEATGGAGGKRGTEIMFLPSPSIFATRVFDFARLEHRFRTLTIPHARVMLLLIDSRGVDRQQVAINL